jgi:hypothetical protein
VLVVDQHALLRGAQGHFFLSHSTARSGSFGGGFLK